MNVNAQPFGQQVNSSAPQNIQYSINSQQPQILSSAQTSKQTSDDGNKKLQTALIALGIAGAAAAAAATATGITMSIKGKKALDKAYSEKLSTAIQDAVDDGLKNYKARYFENLPICEKGRIGDLKFDHGKLLNADGSLFDGHVEAKLKDGKSIIRLYTEKGEICMSQVMDYNTEEGFTKLIRRGHWGDGGDHSKNMIVDIAKIKGDEGLYGNVISGTHTEIVKGKNDVFVTTSKYKTPNDFGKHLDDAFLGERLDGTLISSESKVCHLKNK